MYFEYVQSPAREVQRTEVESAIAGTEHAEMIEYLANISRTMTFFRRLVWGMLFVMLLNVALMGAGLFFTFRQLASLSGLFARPANVGAPLERGRRGQAGRDLQQAGRDMQQIEEYLRTLNELLQDVPNQ